jgi:hypothetical protein
MAPKLLISGFAIRVDARHPELLHLQFPDELVIEDVAKGSVAEVVTETSDGDVANLFFCYLKLRLVLS